MSAVLGVPMRSIELWICIVKCSSPSTTLSSTTVKLVHLLMSPGKKVSSSSNMPTKSSSTEAQLYRAVKKSYTTRITPVALSPCVEIVRADFTAISPVVTTTQISLESSLSLTAI